MEHTLKIKEISPEPIVVRKTKRFISRLPRLTMDKKGRLILLTDDLKRFLSTYKSSVLGLIFSLGSFGGAAQEFKDTAIDGGEFAQWVTFTEAGEVGNTPDVDGSKSDIILKQLTPGAMATSSGNIYHPSGASKFVITDKLEGTLKKLVLQIKTAGVPANYDSFTLKSGDLSLNGVRSEVSSGDNGVVSLIDFDIGSNVLNNADYSINFSASGAHMSLVSLRLDILQEVAAKPLAFKKFNTTNSEFAEWETFTVGFGEPGNGADVAGSKSGAIIIQATPGAVATGSGSIYNPGGVSKFNLTDTLNGKLKEINFQIWTKGSPANYESFILKSGDKEFKGAREEIVSRDGSTISNVTFNTSEAALENISYSIEFAASGPHMSLAAARVDINYEQQKPLAFEKFDAINSEFAEWEIFTVGFGDPGNDPDVDGSKSGATITQTTPGAMVTSTGNIYNPGGVSNFALNDKFNGVLMEVNFQIWTKGSPADYDSFVLKIGDNGFKGVREEIVSRDGSTISNVTFNASELSQIALADVPYSIEFVAAGPHLSLAAARLDIRYVQELVYEFKDVLSSDSEYAEWKDFTTAFGEPGNEADATGSKTGVFLYQTTPGAMVTSTKNIYNPGSVSKFELKDSFIGKLDKLIFQIWTVGSPADYESFKLVSGDTEIVGMRTELIDGSKGVISLIDFNLDGYSIVDGDFQIEFQASGPHMSFVAARLDYELKEVIIQYQEFNEPGWSHDGWINFTDAVDGWNEPDMEGSIEVTFEEGAILRQKVAGAMITSTKNIYNPGGISAFEISDARLNSIIDVVLQIRTTGSPVNQDSVTLNIGEDKYKGTYSEVAKRKTRYGYDEISKFEFDLDGASANEYLIEFSASGPHMSLVSARVDRQSTASYELNKDYTANFNEPSDDRWTYPRNSTPGKRNLAPVFGFVSGEGDDRVAQRYGQMIIGFDTSSKIPLGLHYTQYKIKSVKMSATVALDQQFPYDGTVDDYSKYNGVDDTDSPVELFGVGFRNGYNSLNWNESSPLSDRNDNGNHNVYSLGFQDGNSVDADYFNFSKPHTAKPFAVGQIEGLEQGDLVPEDSVFQFKIDVNSRDIQNYIAKSLSKGKVFFALSQILYGKTEDGGKGYPDFYTSDHILGEGPKLAIDLEIVPARLEPPTLSIKRKSEGGLIIEWTGEGELQRTSMLGQDAFWETIKTSEKKHVVDAKGLYHFYRLKGQ